MKILLTNIWLNNHASTEVYTRDLAIELHKRGHTVEVFSPQLGLIAKEIASAGINVVSNLDDLHQTPDIIHGHQFIPTVEAMNKFRQCPAIHLVHDYSFAGDIPPITDRIMGYYAVDHHCLKKLPPKDQLRHADVDVVYNWVDTQKFTPKKSIAKKPLKALVFSNYARQDNHYQIIKTACEQLGIELDGIGKGLGTAVERPQDILGKYDLVFAKAKAAMEAMASGCAVVVCDFRGLGGMVTQENFEHFRRLNFGMASMTQNIDVASIITEVQKYNPEEVTKMTARIRAEAAFDRYVDKMEVVYQQAIQKWTQVKDTLHEDAKYFDLYQHGKSYLIPTIDYSLKAQLFYGRGQSC